MEDASIKLEAIAKELANVITLKGKRQNQETIQFGESKFTIYRYHRANVIAPNTSNISAAIHESGRPYALSLHLFLEPAEFCLESGSGILLSFETNPESLVVTTGKELEVRLGCIYIREETSRVELNFNFVGRGTNFGFSIS